MALTLYRRHLNDCKHKGKGRHDARARNCQCPIWVQGVLGIEKIRRALNQTHWEGAQHMIDKWDAQGDTAEAASVPPISDAVTRFIDDVGTRGLKKGSVEKYEHLLQRRLLPWCTTQGFTALSQLDVDAMSRFRATWGVGPLTMQNDQSKYQAFFRFCENRDWVKRSPIGGLSKIKVVRDPTLPFEPDEMKRILETCDHYNGDGKRLKALVLLMRWSGLAIRDATTCRRDRLTATGELNLYRAKTGQHVFVPLPPLVVEALSALQNPNPEYFFWTGKGQPGTVVGIYRTAFNKLFAAANIQGAHPHRFRDTFAVELLKAGVALQSVSMLLGHASIQTTEQHYKPWVKALQDRLAVEAKKGWV